MLLVVALPVRAGQPAEDLTLEAVKKFNTAYQAWDGNQFATAAELFRQATTNAPESGTNFYWLGTTLFHYMLQLQNQPGTQTNVPAANAALEGAISSLEQAVKLNPADAESHALLGTLYGMKIGGSLIRGVRFGPRVAEHCRKALEYGKGNPRVQYLLGTCQFHTARKAAAWREALATLLKADELYKAEAKTPSGPLEARWGHDSCLTFIGRTYEQLGEPKRAAEFYQQAIAARPADHLAKEGLGRVTEGIWQ